MKKNKAFVFNAYGAILDTYLPFEEYKDQLGEHALVIYKLWRSKRLQYSSQLSLMNRFTNYDLIRKYALEFACDVYGMKDEGVKNKILEASSKLDCYPDVKEVLKALKDAGKITAVLSNDAPKVLSTALKNAGVDKL